MPICEGCGARVDDAHALRRKQRVDLAMRFRPTQIKTLLLNASPPELEADYFYRVAPDRSVRSAPGRIYFDELMKCMGPAASQIDESRSLNEFRQQGFFLIHAVDCPIENPGELHNAMRRLAPTVVKRVQYSLLPIYIVPISKPTQDLIRLFGLIGWGDRLVLENGGPFSDAGVAGPQRQASSSTASFGDRIHKALALLM
ncbi:MAG TPA: hypothetical protein VN881_10815 [Candidatus Acidoferrales bacterium]|jgi:hypothetical protein|nr:hypothetical protein [Candidatus Acidoferrales bacterium]